MSKKVLVVDDEPDILELIRYNLRNEGYEVVTARNGKEALEKISPLPDLIILDLMMPVMDGLETCKRLKADPRTARVPILFLTARSGEVDEVLALELGADDYIRKPITPRKLSARVKALFRRYELGSSAPAEEPIIKLGRLEIHRANRSVRLGSQEIFFPRKEFEILALLAGSPGRVFSREMLLDQVWGNDVVVIDRTIDVHIRKIREKLGDEAEKIETLKGVGYRFRE
jgi:two-component system, OmpR family, alkaline phosphatase synthesis response regulator PhoP